MSRHYSWTRLYEAVKNENIESISEAIFYLDTRIHTTALELDKNALNLAAHLGKVESLRILFETLNFLHDTEKFRLVSDVLKRACQSGQAEIVEFVLESENAPTRPGKSSRTFEEWQASIFDDMINECLYDGVRQGSSKIVNLLLKKYYSTTVAALQTAKCDIVYLVFQYGLSSSFIERIHEHLKPVLNTCNPFHQAMLRRDWYRIEHLINVDEIWYLSQLEPPEHTTTTLIDHERVTVDNSDNFWPFRREHFSIFQYAVVLNDAEMMTFLLEKASNCVVDLSGLIAEACDLAFERGKLDMLKILENTSDLRYTRENANRLLRCAKEGRVGVCRYFIEKYYLETSADACDLKYVLSWIVRTDDTDLVRTVLRVLRQRYGRKYEYQYASQALWDALSWGLPDMVKFLREEFKAELRSEYCWCSVIVRAWQGSVVCVEMLGPRCIQCRSYVMISLLEQWAFRNDPQRHCVVPYLLLEGTVIRKLRLELVRYCNDMHTLIAIQDYIDEPMIDIILNFDRIFRLQMRRPIRIFWDYYNLYQICLFFRTCCGSKAEHVNWYGLLAGAEKLPKESRRVLTQCIIESGIRVTDEVLENGDADLETDTDSLSDSESDSGNHLQKQKRLDSEGEKAHNEMLKLSKFPSPSDLSLKAGCRIVIRRAVRIANPKLSLTDSTLEFARQKILPKSVVSYLLFRDRRLDLVSLMDVKIQQVFRDEVLVEDRLF